MKHALLTVVASVLFAGVSYAQRVGHQQDVEAVRQPTPAKDAGIYHVATGTWSRDAPQAALGPDVIYRNDVSGGYFGTGWEGITGVDEGILPGPSSVLAPGGAGGPLNAYSIEGLKFGYCALNNPGGIDWNLQLYDSYVPCDSPDLPKNCIHAASGVISLTGLPTASSCWIVTLDLTGGAEFCMSADGGPCNPGSQSSNPSMFDSFGFASSWNNQGVLAGPIFAGDPTWAPEGEGTCYAPWLTCPSGASGLGQINQIGVGDPWNGCLFTSSSSSNGCGTGRPWPDWQFHLTLFTDCAQECLPECVDSIFCDPAVPNTTGQPGLIAITDCSVSSDSILVTAGSLPQNRFGYLLIGAGNGVISAPPGSIGDLCLGGNTIGRYARDVHSTGFIGLLKTDILNGVTGGGSGNLPHALGGVLSPGQTWNFQYWYRDAGTSNFTNAMTVSFLP